MQSPLLCCMKVGLICEEWWMWIETMHVSCVSTHRRNQSPQSAWVLLPFRSNSVCKHGVKLGGGLCHQKCKPNENYNIQTVENFYKYQPRVVDHSARGSMKNAANCVQTCELQDTWTPTFWTHMAAWNKFQAMSGWGSDMKQEPKLPKQGVSAALVWFCFWVLIARFLRK